MATEKGRGRVSSDLFKYFSAHHIEDNKSKFELFALRILLII